MKNLLPVLLVLSLLIAVAVATAVGIVLLMSDASSREVAFVLTYEIGRQRVPEAKRVDVPELIEAIDGRLNPGFSSVAEVDKDEAGRITVGVFGDNPARLAQIQRLLNATGWLEIRPLPNSQNHRKLIDLAKQEDGQEIRNQAGDLRAQWAPMYEQNQPGLPGDSWIVRRTKVRDGRSTVEVLVINDDFGVDQGCVEKARADTDHTGQPCVVLTLNTDGQQRLASLIEKHQPDPAAPDEEPHRLGILLDGRLCSISDIDYYYYGGDQSQSITGNFTREEVKALATVLNTDPLPAGLKLVDRQKVDR